MKQNIPLPKLLEIGVKNKQLSQFLCKYRTIDSAKKLLENNSLWFSSPKEFNDPFDCQIVPDTNNTREEIAEFIKKNTFEQLSDEVINDLSTIVFNEPNRWKDTIESTFDKIINSTGICCFTLNEQNLLMWSHYTDSHKGICLKFDILKDPNFFVYPLPVNYSQDYPIYNHLGNRETIVKDMVLTKSLDWEYEGEIRVLKMNKNGLIPFKKESLVEIIFGCNTSPKDIAEIIELSNKNHFDVRFKKAEKMQREFGLEIIDL